MINMQPDQFKKILWLLPIALVFIVAITSVIGGMEFVREHERLQGDLLLTTTALDHAVEQEVSSVKKVTRRFPPPSKATCSAATFPPPMKNRHVPWCRRILQITSSFTMKPASNYSIRLSNMGDIYPITNNIDRVKDVFASARPQISNLVIGTISRQFEIFVDVPVMRDGKVIYVLTSVLNSNELRSIILDQPFPDEWVANIFDRSGVVVSRTRDHEKFVGSKVSERLLRPVATGHSGVY